MKRANNLLNTIADIENLRLAFWKARKGKTYSQQVATFRADLDHNLGTIQEEIRRGSISVGDYHYFKIFDPKERQICASAFREQVMHHALMNICHDYFERVQIFDSYASRKGKGTYAAIERAKNFNRSYTYYLKLDVQKFFASIEHTVLKTQLDRLFKDSAVLSLFYQIIDSYETQTQRGLPIGNLSSQYFANHYLTGLDHFIKETLHIKAYVRYMDDMILWHNDKEVLKQAHQAIKDFVETKLKCRLKPEQLNYTSLGLPFLGYKLFPYTVKLSQRSKQRFIKKIRYLNDKYHSGEWEEAICQRRVLPLLAFVKKADTKGFRKGLGCGV